jgi:hypothetical protein
MRPMTIDKPHDEFKRQTDIELSRIFRGHKLNGTRMGGRIVHEARNSVGGLVHRFKLA